MRTYNDLDRFERELEYQEDHCFGMEDIAELPGRLIVEDLDDHVPMDEHHPDFFLPQDNDDLAPLDQLEVRMMTGLDFKTVDDELPFFEPMRSSKSEWR